MRIEEYSVQELFELLNELDETDSLEAKSLHEDSTRSIMESVCAFSNEPGMGGGVILLGARESKDVGRDAPLVVDFLGSVYGEKHRAHAASGNEVGFFGAYHVGVREHHGFICHVVFLAPGDELFGKVFHHIEHERRIASVPLDCQV